MIGEIIFMLFLWVSGILSAIGLGFAAYYVLSAPFRRADCANLVVELNELAAATGQTPEQLFRELGGGKISDVPYRGKFRRLHSLMQHGDTFIESLRRFHSLLPGEIFGAMELACNERSTQLMAKLSRAHLEDGVSRAQQSFKLFSSSLLFLIPTSLMLSFGIFKFVLPKLKEVFWDMGIHGGALESTAWIMEFSESGLFILVPVILTMYFLFLTVTHLFGLSISHNTGMHLNQLFSRLAWMTPWRRNRIKRSFIWFLSELLDNGATETEAIRAAAAGTKNSVVRARAELAMKDLESGKPLSVALRRFDRRADLAWRMENASHGGITFREALEGWTNHLSALAYKQEQSGFYVFFTTLMLVNSLYVFGIAVMIILPLATLIENMTLL